MALEKIKQLLGRGNSEDSEEGNEGTTGPPVPWFMKKKKQVDMLLPAAEQLLPFFPNMKRDLLQAEMGDRDHVRYLAECLHSALKLGLMVGLGMLALGLTGFDQLILYAFVLTPIIIVFGVFTLSKRPSVKAKKRTRQLEKELPYAMRHILIEVEAGISLYQAMVSVTEDYGEASDEFKKIVSDINGGKSEIEALEDAILRNPSQQFRRSVWQLINALKSGADVSSTLSSLVDTMMEKQILAVEKYGKELNPYTLMYMMIAIIMPSLGVTFLMILSTMTGMNLTNTMFYGILVGLVLFQLVYINIVDSKRPMVKT